MQYVGILMTGLNSCVITEGTGIAYMISTIISSGGSFEVNVAEFSRRNKVRIQ